MKEITGPIEQFFFKTLLQVSLLGVSIIALFDFYHLDFAFIRSTVNDLAILGAIGISFILLKNNYYRTSVVLLTGVTSAAMLYESVDASEMTTASMSVMLVIGFSYALLLQNPLKRIMHGITLSGIAIVFCIQSLNPQLYLKENVGEVITVCITYFMLYFIITYSAGTLKEKYDAMLVSLAQKNRELIEQSNEIETQNEELVQSQEHLNKLNLHLETIVEERTREVKHQNEKLIKYAYTNAHDLRGPVARVLGLIQLAKLELHLDYLFLFEQIEEQTKQIDTVVKKINDELGVKNPE